MSKLSRHFDKVVPGAKGGHGAIKHSSLSRTGKTLLKILESNFDLLVLTIESEAQGYQPDRS